MGKMRIRKALFGPFVSRIANRKKEFKHQLVFGAIFKNEARYLDDWLTFHAGVGVEHFYLYNNKSTDDYQTVLEPWIRKGMVTLTDWPYHAAQIAAYADCIARHKNDTRWMALIDIDEFVFSPQARHLPDVLKRYDKVPGVFAYWVLFGSSGHEKRPEASQIDAYTMRMDLHTAQTEVHPKGVTGKARQGKTIFNPRLVMSVDHCCPLMWSGNVVDEKFAAPPRLADSVTVSWDVLRINHYWSRSLEDIHDKVARGQAKNGRSRDLERFLQRESQLNKEQDLTILPLWHEIRDEARRAS